MPRVGPRPGAPLTAVQVRVLTLAAYGMTNAEIARHAAMAEKTVADTLWRAYIKLHARNRAHAVALGLVKGVVRLPREGHPDTAGQHLDPGSLYTTAGR